MNTLASSSKLIKITVRITRIRSVNRKGCIAFGHRVDLEKGLNDRSSAIVVSVPISIVEPSTIVVGGIFEIFGEATLNKREHGSFVVSETQINAQDIKLVRPSGSQIIQWLADNVKGIREVKATKLWDTLGERLYDALDQRDHTSIEQIIPSLDVRNGLFDKWAEDGDGKTLRFVQEHRIPLNLARKVIKFHGKNTVPALIEDPYRLLSFEGEWRCVDQIARETFKIPLDDLRRLTAALEEALYGVIKQKHTCAPLEGIYKKVKNLIAPYEASKSAFEQALAAGEASGQFVVRETKEGLILHATGLFLMEKECAEFIRTMLLGHSRQQSFFKPDIENIIKNFEREEQTISGVFSFSLNDEQCAAVKTSFENRFSIITGGAGVGKTTVLKALYRVLNTLSRPRFQMALSGRATARMIEATGEPAMTIASFLLNVTDKDMGPSPVIVIDEASMLDLVTFYNLVHKLPADAHLILVGDAHQLPPIGAGLVFHVLCELSLIPTSQLTEVKRQAKESTIPIKAKSIRLGEWPDYSIFKNDGFVFVGCKNEDIISEVIRLYEQDRDGTQILCATRDCGFAGVKTINRTCHIKYVSDGEPLMLVNKETGEVENTGFREGDLLLYTVNDWPRNLQNGSLGKLIEVFPSPVEVVVYYDEDGNPKNGTAIGLAIFEGMQHYVLDRDVDVLEHAYAITVHKAQGSEFKRVIVPIKQARRRQGSRRLSRPPVLDRTFIYTAVTRAKLQVILVGDIETAKMAVESEPRAAERQIGLMAMLASDQSGVG